MARIARSADPRASPSAPPASNAGRGTRTPPGGGRVPTNDPSKPRPGPRPVTRGGGGSRAPAAASGSSSPPPRRLPPPKKGAASKSFPVLGGVGFVTARSMDVHGVAATSARTLRDALRRDGFVCLRGVLRRSAVVAAKHACRAPRPSQPRGVREPRGPERRRAGPERARSGGARRAGDGSRRRPRCEPSSRRTSSSTSPRRCSFPNETRTILVTTGPRFFSPREKRRDMFLDAMGGGVRPLALRVVRILLLLAVAR